MNQVVYTIDASESSTKQLSRAPGAFWDLGTDEIAAEHGKSATVGVVDNNMTYSPALETTLKRIKSTMYELLDVPETNAESLKGVVTSGKTLKAMYWGLMTRCDEKWIVWQTALEWLVRMIIEGTKVFPQVRKAYSEQGQLIDNYIVDVDNQYPLLDDELEEKDSDLAEVNAKARSRKSYMKKWNDMDDDDVNEEIAQIIEENEIDSSYPEVPPIRPDAGPAAGIDEGADDEQPEDGAEDITEE